MRAVLQRVRSASVTVDGQTVGSIGRDDEPADETYVVEKTANMRIFPDDDDHMNRSALEVGAELLVVSQFTLYADTRKGRRPSFTAAAPPESAAALFDDAVERFRATGLRVETGRFGEMMDVALVNDGPVTIWVDSAERHRPRRG